MSIDARTLAAAFADNVAAYLGPATLAEVNARNSAPGAHPDACASHDFCDANMLMLEALEFFGVEFDPADEAQALMMSQAWSMAKAARFDPRALE